MLEPASFLIKNGGRLDPAWYEPHDLEELLSKWITDAGEGSDDLTRARVYRRAFTTAADLLMAEPASQRDRDKSSTFASEQLSYWRAIADEYAREIDVLTNRGGPVLTKWEDDRCGY